MIISHRHRFIFFHNPKVGGTSVRATIEHLHDDPEIFWGTDEQRTGGPLDRAHLGIDEFAGQYPELWQRVRGYAMFCLYRDPQARFFSSLAEYSKLHGQTDTRFAGAAARKAVLMELVAQLEDFGTAEALIPEYTFRHFRPQWIYWQAEAHPGLDITSLPVGDIDRLFEAIGARCGETLSPATRNRGDQLDLPGALAPLAAHRGLKRLAGRLPGMGAVKAALRQRFSVSTKPAERFGLSAPEQRGIEDFIARFYARDRAAWPEPAPEV